ncbi:MAG: DUF1566 domain-containing protein [Dysgonamonadaceae bacterium]|jgi:hypothetical protein|nr:DUF1566 domain-containing protein [Dysgonamonadaceae bacterium]
MKKITLLTITLISILGYIACSSDDNSSDGTPILKISTSGNKADYHVGESVVVTVSVENASVAEVQLFVNDAAQPAKTSAPYSFTLSGLGRGAYTLKAVATNSKSAKFEVSTVITVQQPGSESPNEVSFADGKLPAAWSANGWTIDNSDKQNDTYSVKATAQGSVIETSKVTTASSNYLEYYVKGNGILKFQIDGHTGKLVNLTNSWKKQIVFLESGLHSLKWEVLGSSASLDAVTFKANSELTVAAYYQGGIVTDILNGGKRILIAAPEDYPGLLTFSNGSEQVPGSFSKTGEVNTQDIIKVYEPLSGGKLYAAKIIDQSVYNGYDDWFIPNIDELLAFIDNRQEIGGYNFDGLDTKYWSSSSESAHVLMYLQEQPEANRRYRNTSQYQAHHVRPFRVIVSE